MQEKTQREAAKNWDKFYKVHEDRFFKDRHWTDREFAELQGSGEPLEQALGGETPVLLEVRCLAAAADIADSAQVGCGVGNTVYPLLEKNAALRVHCCDFSPRAVDMVKVRRPAGATR